MGLARRANLRNEVVPRFRAQVAELLERELRALRRRLVGGVSGLGDWLDGFYADHEVFVTEAMLPLVTAYGRQVAGEALEEVGSEVEVPVESFARQYTEGLAARWTNDSVAQVRQLLRDEDAEDVEELLGERFDEWEATRPQWTAEREATQAAGGFAKTALLAAGITRLVWRSNPGACELCEAMDGRTVEIHRAFLEAGDSVTAEREGDRVELVADQRIGHPPLHGMGGRGGVCQCQVAAA